jgi:D-glycero-D-manno-heptose 1,7-bisphosphate phosphatase
MSLEALERVHARLREALARDGARLDALFFCPDPPDRRSSHRKPAPGMLRDALARFGVAAADAVMIGDDLRDLEAAAALGMPRRLVRTGHGARVQAEGIPPRVLPVAVDDDLAAAVDALLGDAR